MTDGPPCSPPPGDLRPDPRRHPEGMRPGTRHPGNARPQSASRPSGGRAMTASVSSAYAGASPSHHTGLRIAVGVLGAATVVVGVVLLFNPVAAAHTLALLIGLSFVLGGLLEIAAGWE